MKTYYICEICGHRSVNIKETEACEKKGKPNQYKVGDRVLCMVTKLTLQQECEMETIAKIKKVNYRVKTHKVTYNITWHFDNLDRHREITSDKIIRKEG